MYMHYHTYLRPLVKKEDLNVQIEAANGKHLEKKKLNMIKVGAVFLVEKLVGDFVLQAEQTWSN